MALKSINVDAPSPSKKTTMPSHRVPGSLVSRYGAAHAKYKDAEAELKSTEAELKPIGLSLFVGDRVQGVDTSSVLLEDATGAKARFTFQDKYNLADAAVADEVFNQVGEDINDFAAETLKPSFDAKFFVKPDGSFDQKAYDMTVKALGDVANKLGKSNPLSAKKVVTPKPVFITERWSTWDADTNLKLCTALPNTCTMVPVS